VTRHRTVGVLSAIFLLASVAGRGVAQDTLPPTSAPTPSPPGTGEWGAFDVSPRPGTTVVSVTLLLPHGSASDPTGASGSAWVTGEVLRRAVEAALDPELRASTELDVQVDRTRTAFRLVTLPERWRDAWDALEEGVFERRAEEEDLEAVRAELQEVFAFESDAPVREFEDEFRRLIAGPRSPWSRDPRGSPETVDDLTLDDVGRYRTRHYDRSTAAVVVVGALSSTDAAEAVTGQPPPAVGWAAAADLEPRGSTSAAILWNAPQRVGLTREVTSSWIGVAFPVDPTIRRTVLEMLTHRLVEELDTDPPHPGTFSVQVRLEELRGHPLLTVEAAVLPDVAEAWEARILDSIELIAAEELDPSFFAWHRRHFRSARLLEEAAPEAEGLRRAEDLLRAGRPRDLRSEMWTLEGRQLARAALTLGPPRILVLGPDLSAGVRTP